MYRIKFYDNEGCLIATHMFVADNLRCGLEVVDAYCQAISKSYTIVTHWFIYDYSGSLLTKGTAK